MADKLTFELVSPERLLLSVEAEMVTVPGMEGDFGVLPGHAPMISGLRAGGVAEIAADELVVLAEEAVPVSELDRATLEQRIQNAREDLEDAADDEARRLAEGKIRHFEDLLGAVG
jgi:F-type H+-transporting ATPase subunit epsilon